MNNTIIKLGNGDNLAQDEAINKVKNILGTDEINEENAPQAIDILNKHINKMYDLNNSLSEIMAVNATVISHRIIYGLNL